MSAMNNVIASYTLCYPMSLPLLRGFSVAIEGLRRTDMLTSLGLVYRDILERYSDIISSLSSSSKSGRTGGSTACMNIMPVA